MKNVHEIEITIDGKEWETSLDKAFKKKNKEVKIDGFRKGTASKEVYLKKFGIESLYMDAIDMTMDQAYQKCLKENKLVPVIEPKVDVKTIDEQKVIFQFTIITKPEVKLGEYKNLNIPKEKAQVNKEEIATEIENLRNKFAEITVKNDGEAIAIKDTAIINFKGYVDGKELEGGSGENFPLEIGSNTFIPGFETGLVGLKKGDKKTLDLKFPEGYANDLGNKDVKFDVEVMEIKTRVLPEVNKDFFEDLGYDKVTNQEELEQEVEKVLKEQKEKEIDDLYLEKCLEKAADNMTIELNEEIISDEVHRMIHQFESQLQMQGITLEQYSQFTGLDHEKLHEQMAPEATKRVKYRYLLEEVAEQEKIDFTEKEVEEKSQEMAENYGISKEELLEAYGSLEVVKYDMKMREAMEIIRASK
ncbi:MAG: trigger factor [Bacilli bacterium]|jgi:trigger factor|nr:trigger factor [Bacilli bacterium]